MSKIRATRFLLVPMAAMFLMLLHGVQMQAQTQTQALIEIDPTTGPVSVRIPVGTPFVLTARMTGYSGDPLCAAFWSGDATFSLSGQNPPGTGIIWPYFPPDWEYAVVALEGAPTIPGVYEMTGHFWEAGNSFELRGLIHNCGGVVFNYPIEIVVTEPQVDSLEVIQAIQEKKSPSDLYVWLTQKPPDPLQTGDMPVPLVEGKPVLVRVYMKEVQYPTVVKVKIGVLPPPSVDPSQQGFDDERTVSLIPGCKPRDQRLHLQSSGATCQSADFYWDSSHLKAGTYKLWVGLQDMTNIPHDCSGLVDSWSCPEYWANTSAETRSSGSGYLVGLNLGCLQPSQIDEPMLDVVRQSVDWEFQRTAVWGCTFPRITVNKPDAIVIHPVSVCDDPADQPGGCGDVTEISRMSAMLKQVAPTGKVQIGSSGVPLEVEPLAVESTDQWWDRMTNELEKRTKETPGFQSVAGEKHIVYGVVRPQAPATLADAELSPGGQAAEIGGNAAASRTSVIRFVPTDGSPPGPGQEVDLSVEVVAHETGHLFKLEHTHSGTPHTDAAPGCYGAGAVDNPDKYKSYYYWPYVVPKFVNNKDVGNSVDFGNYLYSGDPASPKMEVGVDFTRNRVRGTAGGDPNQSFEMMSYCSPRWVTPWSYRGMYQGLLEPTTLIPLGSGIFDEVSGTITESGLVFGPVFTVQASGPTDQGTGSYRIEVRNSTGGVLFTRAFTLQASTTESASGDIQGPPHFAELIPHQEGAASFAVMDDTGTQLGSVQFAGTAPAVKILFPAGGEVLQGVQNIRWSATDPDSPNLVYRVQYSADNGNTWNSLIMSYHGLTLPVNFDQLPGASGTALIRVYASDSVNTGQATSKPFSVPKKLPKAKISYPANGATFHVGEFLNLEGIGFDADTGILTGTSLTWSSTGLGGALGTGEEVSFGYLRESAVGTQTIKLTATDSDGNQATDSKDIVVQEQPPVVYPDQPPVANAGETYTGTEGSPIVFSSNGSYSSDFTALTYVWNFGDGGTASGQSPSHVYADNGSYQVTLTVTDQKGRTATATATATISNVLPTVVAGAAITGRNTRPINLAASFSDPGLHDAPWKVTWTFGDGSTSPITSMSAQGAIAISHTYQAVGQFQVMVTVTDKDGGSGSAAIPVTITSISDVNNDGKVNCADMAIVKASFGKKTGQAGFDPRADVNGDGIVNVLDLSAVARQLPLGTTCP